MTHSPPGPAWSTQTSHPLSLPLLYQLFLQAGRHRPPLHCSPCSRDEWGAKSQNDANANQIFHTNFRTMRMRIKYSVPISERCECESCKNIANNRKIIAYNRTYLHANTMYIEHRDYDSNANILKTLRLLRLFAIIRDVFTRFAFASF